MASAILVFGAAAPAAPVGYFPYTNVFTSATITGATPYSALVMGVGGVLFGTAVQGGPNGDGVLFQINPDGTGYSVLHYFGVTNNDGVLGSPLGVLISRAGYLGGLMIASNNQIYGTTPSGGSNGLGTLYTIRQDGSGYQILYSFTSEPASPVLQGVDGMFYGKCGYTDTAPGVYKISPTGSDYTNLHQFTGNATSSGLIQGNDGFLYGTSQDGGYGSIFRMDTNGLTFTNLYTFTGGADGFIPSGSLVQGSNNVLFGTTSAGGSNNFGDIYEIHPDGSGFQVLYAFTNGFVTNSDDLVTNYQGLPASGLVIGPGGYLYGTTTGGVGGGGEGSVYQIAQNGSGFTQLHVFQVSPNDALAPHGALCVGSSSGTSGVLFGTSIVGGQAGIGAIFAILLNPPATITPVTSAGQTTVFWPSWALGYHLQATTNLGGGTWTDVTNGVSVIGVQLPAPGNAFFRLVYP